MKQTIALLLLSMMTTTVSASRTMTVSVSNPMNIARADVPVVINLAPYGEVLSALVTLNGQEIPCQLDDLNQDETFDELCFLANLDKKEKQQYTVTLMDEGEPRTYPARVFAEMVLSNTKDEQRAAQISAGVAVEKNADELINYGSVSDYDIMTYEDSVYMEMEEQKNEK